MRKRSQSFPLGVSFTTLALAATLATGAAGCAATEVAYCADEYRYIVEAVECERDDSPYFIYYGYWGDSYAPGAQLRQSSLKGRVKASDAAARTRVGLPPRGEFSGNGASFSSGG